MAELTIRPLRGRRTLAWAVPLALAAGSAFMGVWITGQPDASWVGPAMFYTGAAFFATMAMVGCLGGLGPDLVLDEDELRIGRLAVPWRDVARLERIDASESAGFVRVRYGGDTARRSSVRVTAALGRIGLYVPPSYLSMSMYKVGTRDLCATLTRWRSRYASPPDGTEG